MNEVVEKELLIFDKESPQSLGTSINIQVNGEYSENTEFKFMTGIDGVWTTLSNYSDKCSCVWTPKENGKYLVMVQIRDKQSKKPFDSVLKKDYIVGTVEEKLIKEVYIGKSEYSIGEKVIVEVETTQVPAMYRFWIDEKDGWKLIRDYGTDNKINFTCIEEGKHQILVECKTPYSKNNFDDFKTVDFTIKTIKKLEISDFKCLTNDLLTGEDLVFKVEVKNSEDRTVLYKFVKIDESGKTTCVQDFSSRNLVSFTEGEQGNYKLLCLVKDMYSQKQYDDRAVILYNVIPYYPIKITNFTTDLSSPQAEEKIININTIAEGGKNLLYRYVVDGPYSEDSGFLRKSTYEWKANVSGDYKISVFIKDESFQGEYEATASFDFLIEKKVKEMVKITDITVDRENNYLVGKPVNIKVIAEGAAEIRYKFVVYKDGKLSESIPYGAANWVNFTPEEVGEYQIEIMVKSRFSDKPYDVHSYKYINAKKYIDGKIEHVLVPSKENYMVGDEIPIECITLNSEETVIKYVTKVENILVEETEFIKDKKIVFTPKRSGRYKIDMYVKNIKSTKEFDSKKEVYINIIDALPITETKISCDNPRARVDEEINFTVNNCGGKDVCYEFYMLHNNNWSVVQKYSRKNYYTFRPFDIGEFNLLVLAKSYYKNCTYEDYDEFKFEVKETNK